MCNVGAPGLSKMWVSEKNEICKNNMFENDLELFLYFKSISAINKGPRGPVWVGQNLESSKNDKKMVGAKPQALISYFKPIINNKSQKNTITNANKSKKTPTLFAPIEPL